MHTHDEKIGKTAARRDRRGPENSTCGLKGTLRCRLSHMFFCDRLKVHTFGIILQ